MFDFLRMDLRRIRKTRSFYILLAIQGIAILFSSFMLLLLIDPKLREMALGWGMEITVNDYTEMAALLNHSMAEAYHSVLIQGGFFFVILYAYTTTMICGDFSSGFAKNIFSLREKRIGYAVSRFLALEIVNVIYFVVTVLIFEAFCRITGLAFQRSSLLEYGKLLLVVLTVGGAFMAQGMLVAFLTRSQGAGIGAAFLLGGGVVTEFLMYVAGFFHLSIGNKTLYGVAGSLQFPLTGKALWYPMLVGVIWTVIYFVLAAVILQKKDV